VKRRKILLVAMLVWALTGCNNAWESGDRVLVARHLYEADLMEPRRFDVVVFKYPVAPVDHGTPKNYIKRLLGLPGEIIAIFFGQLFRFAPEPGAPFPYNDDQVNPNDLWRRRDGENTRGNQWGVHEDYEPQQEDPFAREKFEAGKFEIIRKPPDVMLAMRRIVFDNDHQPRSLADAAWKRWAPARDSSWQTDADFKLFKNPGKAGAIDWLRYRHIVPHWKAAAPGGPELITDFMAYNSQNNAHQHLNWVGDLMLECELKVDKAQGVFFLELSKGSDRFRARWELDKGTCTLLRQGRSGKWEELASKPTNLNKPGTYRLRFANFDARLTVWVGRDLPFDQGFDYPPPEVKGPQEKITPEQLLARRGPTENDLEPASVGSDGAAVEVNHLQLWRDTYYTLSGNHSDARQIVDWADAGSWASLRSLGFKTLYVQPGHYLCLGDNSPASSDGREWGLVPRRLMLGRALLVYYPFSRAGPIR
jgi:signal peptidase I